MSVQYNKKKETALGFLNLLMSQSDMSKPQLEAVTRLVGAGYDLWAATVRRGEDQDTDRQ